MKKTYQRLPESELDIMLVLWNGTPPMTRPEIEKVINTKNGKIKLSENYSQYNEY